MLTRCVAGALAEELARGGAFRLGAGQAVLNMTENLVVKTGTTLFFDGGGRTLRTGQFGFLVEANAKLCLYNTHLIDGMTSAVEVGRDSAAQADGAVVDMGWTTVSGMDIRRDQRYLGSRDGGAVHVNGKAKLEFYDAIS